MTTYQVSLEQMDFVKGEMDAITQKVQKTLTDLEEGVATTLSQWTGAAQDAYRAAQQQWDQAAQKMSVDLAKASSVVGDIGDFYTSGEKYGVGLWEQ